MTIMCRNDELSWLFTYRFRAFYHIFRKWLVNNQLNSSLWQKLDTLDASHLLILTDRYNANYSKYYILTF